LNEKSIGSRSRKQRLTTVGTRCADHVTPLYPQKLALTSPTGGGRSVGIVRVRTKATEFSLVLRPLNICGQGQLSRYREIATGWTVRGSNLGRARFFAPVQTGPESHTTSYTMGIGYFPVIKRPERSVDHPPPSGAKVKERVELYLYSSSGPSWTVLG